MATPAERKALLFFGLVAILGAGVRVWRARHHANAAAGSASAAAALRVASRSASPRQSRSSTTRRTSVRKAAPGSRTGRTDRDSDALVDLDRASVAEIDALGVLPEGMARLIVADRDSFGPFGSIQELRRVPFLSASTLRKLAPRVTFSRIPRPRNTVIQPRALPAASSARRRAGSGQ